MKTTVGKAPKDCPNLRNTSTGGFLNLKVSYRCSVSGEELNESYVKNVCMGRSVGFGDIDIQYPTCNHYKRCGIRN